MANIGGPHYTGPTVVDVSALAPDLIDLAPNALKGARGPKQGIAEVLAELAHAIPNHGEEAEIHPAVYARIIKSTELSHTLRTKETELEKLLEVCRETRGMLDNNREEDLSRIASTVETKVQAGTHPGLAAHFQKTIEYKSRYAERAAVTRRQNEEAKVAADKAAADKASPGNAGPGEARRDAVKRIAERT